MHSHYMSSKFIAWRQRFICPVITIGVLKLNRFLSVKFNWQPIKMFGDLSRFLNILMDIAKDSFCRESGQNVAKYFVFLDISIL